jgi:hypothetical protein
MKQRVFVDLEYDAKKRTRRERFLESYCAASVGDFSAPA